VHKGGKELVDVLLDHRPDQFAINLDGLNKVVRVNGAPDAFIEMGKHLLELQELDGGLHVFTISLEEQGGEAGVIELLNERVDVAGSSQVADPDELAVSDLPLHLIRPLELLH